MVVVSLSFRPQSHKRAEVLSAVEEVVHRLRVARGCTHVRLYTDSEDANAFTLMAEWRTAADAEAFLDSRDFGLFRGLRFLLRTEPVVVLDEVQSRVTRICAEPSARTRDAELGHPAS